MKLTRAALTVSLVLSILAPPLVAEGQQAGKVWRIGLFHVGLDHIPPSLDGLREGLKGLGYEEGRNIRLDFRNLADEEAARVVAREFVRENVDLIVAFEPQTVRAAKAATSTIPIVFLHVFDPVARRLRGELGPPWWESDGLWAIRRLRAEEVGDTQKYGARNPSGADISRR